MSDKKKNLCSYLSRNRFWFYLISRNIFRTFFRCSLWCNYWTCMSSKILAFWVRIFCRTKTFFTMKQQMRRKTIFKFLFLFLISFHISLFVSHKHKHLYVIISLHGEYYLVHMHNKHSKKKLCKSKKKKLLSGYIFNLIICDAIYFMNKNHFKFENSSIYSIDFSYILHLA